MPLSFETFQGEGVVFNLSSSLLLQDSYKIWDNKTGILQEEQEQDLGGYVVGGGEPTSVLEALRSPSPLTSSSTTTLSSSHGGGAAVTATNTTVVAGDDNNTKCSPQMGGDDVDTGGVIQEQSILRLIMDSSSSGGFGVFDPGFGFGSGSVSQNLNPLFQFQEQTTTPHQISNQETGLMNPGLLYSQEDSPPAKRFNSGPVFPFSDPDPGHHDPFLLRRHFQFQQQQQIPSSSSSPVLAPVLAPFPSSRMAGDDSSSVIIEQLFNAAELIGNNDGDQTILAQGILARLNHSLTLLNAPFHRSALHISQALLSLTTTTNTTSSSSLSPENQILKIAAYRSFTETSPFLQFVNFTSNQSIIESCEGYDQIHILDFDVGYGGQWSSLMQELSTRRNRVSFKLTCFVTPPSSVSEEFEIRFTEENLRSFADEIKIPFEIEFLSLELLLNPSYWPLSIRSSEKEVISVNLPVNSVISGYVPLILRYLKQITPNVVVCSDYGCDRNDVPFANGVIHSLQYWSNLIESLDSSGGNSSDDDSSVERYWVKPCVEKMLMKRHRWMERCPPWRSLLTQCGFTPVSLSSTAVAQAECLVQRNNPVRGRFHVEKRQSLSSLVLCWQRKDLVSVSVWKC